MMKLGPYTFY